jgi:hypothetical protein
MRYFGVLRDHFDIFSRDVPAAGRRSGLAAP